MGCHQSIGMVFALGLLPRFLSSNRSLDALCRRTTCSSTQGSRTSSSNLPCSSLKDSGSTYHSSRGPCKCRPSTASRPMSRLMDNSRR